MSTTAGVIAAIPSRGKSSVQPVIATLIVAGGIVLALIMSRMEAVLAPLWLLGMAAGFTLQRARFCFASAFRDLFLFGSGRTMKGIVLGLGVAVFGFALIMYGKVPNPAFGFLPDEANVLPVGLSTIVGGLVFGVGMVLAGGCVSGSLYRMAEGYVGSWVTVVGVVAGMGALFQTWNAWWTFTISREPRIWLPATAGLGYGGAVAVTVLGLIGVFVLVSWREARAGVPSARPAAEPDADDTFRGKMRALWHRVMVSGWSAPVGGTVLAGICVLMYLTHMPWGVTGELGRWANFSMGALGLGTPVLAGLSDIGGCAARLADPGLFTHTFAVAVGVLPGSLVGALYSREFKLRFPKNAARYVTSLGGGLLMGYGAGLGVGCTIGAFFSAIPSLAVSGWLFAVALAGGAFVGTLVIRRIR
jgi:hypothetical protein